MPHADGVPTWESDKVGERLMMKLPKQFKPLFEGKHESLSEAHGQAMAEWARGTKREAPAQPRITTSESTIVERAVAFKDALKRAKTIDQLEKTYNGDKGNEIRTKLDDLNAVEVIKDLALTFESRLAELSELAEVPRA